ncbi:MAG: flagellar M-ring protein FliF C-terminal domain-containing protein [Vulcanimicrobiaceae bacterium]
MLARIQLRWAHLSQRHRVIVGVGIPVLVALLSVFVAIVHPDRVSLFAQSLSSSQMNDVQTTLAGWNVPFTPVDGNIVVNAADRNGLLLRLSLAGVPRTTIQDSRDALSQIGALTPESVIDAQARNGLAGDIELALRGVDDIDDAQVIIAPAQRSDFADERGAQASASVRVHLHVGAVLSRAQKTGIARFVAAAVPGLEAARVTILGDTGGEGGHSDAASSLAREAQSALDAMFGPGVTIVRVHETTDRESILRSDVQRSPLGTVNSTTSVEHFSGAGKAYEKQSIARERGTRTQRTDVRHASGGVARLSVAVAVDAAQHLDLAAIRAIVSASVGIDPNRGDVVVVTAIPFARIASPKRDAWWLAYGALVPLLPALAIAAAILLSVRMALNPLMHLVQRWSERASIAKAQHAVAGHTPARVRDALRDEPIHAAAAILSALPTATAAAVLDLYPESERRAILVRMQREQSPLIPDAEEFIAHA